MLKKIVGQSNTWTIGSGEIGKRERERELSICPKGSDWKRTTFIQYVRVDGKPEETRLDKLIEVI